MSDTNPNGIKAGNTKPLVATLLDADDNPQDLTGCTVLFRMAPATPGIGHDLIEADAEILQDGSTDKGRVQYTWGDGETDDPAVYRLSWDITFGDGTVATAPNAGYVTFEIFPL